MLLRKFVLYFGEVKTSYAYCPKENENKEVSKSKFYFYLKKYTGNKKMQNDRDIFYKNTYANRKKVLL